MAWMMVLGLAVFLGGTSVGAVATIFAVDSVEQARRAITRTERRQ